MKRKQQFCEVCRDDSAEIACQECDNWYHCDCAVAVAENRVAAEIAVRKDEFLCESCLKDAANDTHCSKCDLEESGKKYDSLLLCDGCPKAYHLSCMGLKDEPTEDEWFCPDCAPTKAKAPTPSVANAKPSVNEANLDKHDFCEVCQDTGRLLICDFCPRAYHPSCITLFFKAEDLANEDLWQCPVCQGHSVLRKEVAKVYTQAQLKGRMAERNKENRKNADLYRQRRNRFLKANMSLIKPFMSSSFEKKLKNLAAGKDLSENPVDLFVDGQPAGLLAEAVVLKPYQRTAVSWLYHCYQNLTGAILADDMGLGKTCMSLAFVSYLHSTGVKGPFLIVCPLSTVGNWLREAARFVPHLTVAKLCGSGQERKFALDSDELWFGERDLYITTYETLVSTESFFTQHTWQAVILDEAHRIKAQAARIRTSLCHVDAVFRVLLTGTPLQNNMVELFHLLSFLWPDVLEDASGFEKAVEEGKVKDVKMLEAVKALLGRLMLRRRKDQVISLPAKIEKTVFLPLSSETVRWYTHLTKAKALQETAEGRPLGTKKLLGVLTQLRLVACHPGTVAHRPDAPTLLGEDEARKLSGLTGESHLKASNKLVFVDKLLCTLLALNAKHFPVKKSAVFLGKRPQDSSAWVGEGWRAMGAVADQEAMGYYEPFMCPMAGAGDSKKQRKGSETEDESTPKKDKDVKMDDDPELPIRRNKVLIFSQFTRCLDELEKYCKWRGFEYLRLDGSTNRVIRELDMRDFNAPDSTAFVYLISTRAGGLGINLFSANHVILYDLDYNPHADNQAVDRAHRIGQDRNVFVYRLVGEWGVEERLVYRQQQKIALEAAVVGGRIKERATDEDRPSSAEAEVEAEYVKMDAHEIARLINYGSQVLEKFGGENLLTESVCPPLMSMIARSHKNLPFEETPEGSESDSDSAIDARGEDEGAGIPAEGVPGEEGTTRPQSSSPSEELDPLVGSQQKRVRKETQFYQPNMEFTLASKKWSRPMRHETDCFMCNDGGELVECDICPKVYHLECQHLDDVPPGRWTCSWHECWDCYRKGSQVGGMLIHCFNCPRAYCLDCFPPTFRRTNPPESFWMNLNRYGWEVSPEKMICFTCNDCRVWLDQQKRKQMKSQEIENAKRSLQRQNDLARKGVIEAAANKKSANVPAVAVAYRKSQDFVRAAFEGLLSKQVIDRLAKSESNPSEVAGEDAAQSSFEYFDKMSPRDLLAAASSRGIIISTTMEKKTLIELLMHTPNLRQGPLPVSRKINRLLVSLCTNCRLPGHMARMCPYPQERVWKQEAPVIDLETNKDKEVRDKTVCPICQGNHQRIACVNMPPEIVEQYTQRAKIFDNIARVVISRSPLSVSEEELQLEPANLKNVVMAKVGKIAQELTEALLPAAAALQIRAITDKAKKADSTKKPEMTQDKKKIEMLENLKKQVKEINLKDTTVTFKDKRQFVFATDTTLPSEALAVETVLGRFVDIRGSLTNRKKINHGIIARAMEAGNIAKIVEASSRTSPRQQQSGSSDKQNDTPQKTQVMLLD